MKWLHGNVTVCVQVCWCDGDFSAGYTRNGHSHSEESKNNVIKPTGGNNSALSCPEITHVGFKRRINGSEAEF